MRMENSYRSDNGRRQLAGAEAGRKKGPNKKREKRVNRIEKR